MAMTATRVDVPGGVVHVVATVHGLVSEAERVRAAFAEAEPRVVALGLGAEGVAALLQHVKRADAPIDPDSLAGTKEDPYDYEAADLLTDAEIAYGLALRKFGKVLLPPPDLVAAVELARERDVPVRGVDYSEEQYADAFTARVSTFALLRYSRRARRIEGRPPEAASAREFALAWDAHLTRVKGYALLERDREARMAEGTKLLAREHANALLVLDVAREAGVLAALRE